MLRWAAALAALLAVIAWWAAPEPTAPALSGATLPRALLPDPAGLLRQQPLAPGRAASAAPFSELGLAQREQQRQAAQQRLAMAEQALVAYRAHARHPHGSRPAAEHPDQLRPFDPIAEEHPLRSPHGTALQGVRLRTTQERVFLSGPETARVSLSLVDARDQPLPLQFTRVVFKEVTEPGRTAQTAEQALAFADDGRGADALASDGVHSLLLSPSLQGFGSFAGRLRLEVWMSYGGQPGFVYFDLVYHPAEAARWLPGVEETVKDGSLQLNLRAQVLRAGRYVVSGRIDDADGKPLALALFNEELAAGDQRIALSVHGRLLHDAQPRWPLTLRDVEAFLLLPDAFPDRVMLPRRAGAVHRTQSHALSAFSASEWRSAERERHLAELGRDVDAAQQALKRLGGP